MKRGFVAQCVTNPLFIHTLDIECMFFVPYTLSGLPCISEAKRGARWRLPESYFLPLSLQLSIRQHSARTQETGLQLLMEARPLEANNVQSSRDTKIAGFTFL